MSEPRHPTVADTKATLHQNVREAVYALPQHFETDTQLEGLDATDLFNLNSLLAASIEQEFVETLNQIRSVWDPESEYEDCEFVRQSQTFPDICLQRRSHPTENPLLGIELKSWYLLSKEGEPSLRYKVTPAACAPHDLLVIIPWSLSQVLSGTPVLHDPFVESARYASEYVDHYWEDLRNTSQDTTIVRPDDVTPYPSSKTKIQDKPVHDSGGNYGRLARSGVLDEYIATQLKTPLAGIPAHSWLEFIRMEAD